MCECRWASVGAWAAVVLVAAFLTAGAAWGAEAVGAAAAPPVYQVQPLSDGSNLVGVTVDSAQVLRGAPQWWSRAYKWEGVAYQPGRPAADGSVPFTWNVAGLGISGAGNRISHATNQLAWEWHLTAAKDWPVEGEAGATQPHGGLTFFLDLTAAARRGCTADPVLKADKTGFTWEVTPGRSVTVSLLDAAGRPLLREEPEERDPVHVLRRAHRRRQARPGHDHRPARGRQGRAVRRRALRRRQHGGLVPRRARPERSPSST